MAMHGRRAIVFATTDSYYELIIEGASNTLKFLMLYDILRQSGA